VRSGHPAAPKIRGLAPVCRLQTTPQMNRARSRGVGRLIGACCLAVLSAASQIAASKDPEPSELPSIGESVIAGGLRVTLLDAGAVTQSEYLQAEGHPPTDWAGGAFRLVFLVENRPGQPGPPVLGNVRVLLGATLYNSVTNAISGRPFSPYVVIHPTDRFSTMPYGRQLQNRIPQPRADTVHGILDFFVRGGPIPNGQSAVVELEQGETFQPPDAQRSTAPKANEIVYRWVRFKFQLFS
jgi:hypothetical protein